MQKYLLIALVAGAIPMSMPADAAPKDLRSPGLKACLNNCVVQREQRIMICRRESARTGIGSDDALCRSVQAIRNAYGACTARCR